ncbi:class I SAM-dependent methyltransferase [Streptomyces murinus]|uniref:class I SAM-dependent methyltransferase n=1 Tax=Streptomyces murinus TaxID=33900 RepID=UPI003802CB5B
MSAGLWPGRRTSGRLWHCSPTWCAPPVADVGCGPGHVTAHLRELGVDDAFGIDLSSAMVDVARRDHPRLRFAVGSMTDLDLADTSVAGLFGFHVGDGSRLKTQGYGGHSEVGPHRLI